VTLEAFERRSAEAIRDERSSGPIPHVVDGTHTASEATFEIASMNAASGRLSGAAHELTPRGAAGRETGRRPLRSRAAASLRCAKDSSEPHEAA
jgi:hypothetical protein